MRHTLILILLVLAPALAFSADWPDYDKLEILRVKDGDTVSALIEVYPDTFVKTDVRVSGVNTAESRFARKECLERYSADQCNEFDACEKQASALASDFTLEFVTGRACTLVDVDPQATKFAGRINGDIKCGGELLSAALLGAGHARRYNGEARGLWCE